ncbi:MAG: plasmid-related protein [Pseudomonadota bacterium]
MKDSGMRIRVEPELRREFIEVCRARDLTAAQVLRAYMREYVEKVGRDSQSDLFEHLSDQRPTN